MQPSAFSHEGSGGQHGFYQQGSYGTHHGSHSNVHGYSGYPSHSTSGQHGEQSPSMSYLQPGNHPQMGIYGGYGGHHYNPQQQHYSHVSGTGLGGAAGANPQNMLSGNTSGDYPVSGVHPGSYSHMAHNGMYGYHDPATMMHHQGHGQVPGMATSVGGTVPGAQYAAAGATSGKPAKGGKGANASSGNRKGGSQAAAAPAPAATTKKGGKGGKGAKAAAAAAPASTGKSKSSKAAGGDRHHPYTEPKKEKAPPKKEKKEPVKPPVLKSHLKPPKQAPSAWQVYFTEELQKIKAEQPGARLNVAHVAKDAGQRYAALPDEAKKEFQRRSQEAKDQWERDMLSWKQSLTPEDIKQENMYRTAQRKAGKSRKGNLKDPNAPKKPLSAYFLFLRAIRADQKMTDDVFHGEQETTKQSVLAAAKWRSLGEQEKAPFLEKAEADKVQYEKQRKAYEQANGLAPGSTEDKDDDEDGEDYPPSLAAGTGDEAFKLDSHFGLGGDATDLGFGSGLGH